MISALVILRSAGAEALSRTDPITSDTISHFLPDPIGARDVIREFKNLGFVTGPLIGNSFSIEGKTAHFEEIFGGRIRTSSDGLVFSASKSSVDSEGESSRQLPLTMLAETVQQQLDSIVFPEPPDFGPSDFGGMP